MVQRQSSDKSLERLIYQHLLRLTLDQLVTEKDQAELQAFGDKYGQEAKEQKFLSLVEARSPDGWEQTQKQLVVRATQLAEQIRGKRMMVPRTKVKGMHKQTKRGQAFRKQMAQVVMPLLKAQISWQVYEQILVKYFTREEVEEWELRFGREPTETVLTDWTREVEIRSGQKIADLTWAIVKQCEDEVMEMTTGAVADLVETQGGGEI